MPLKLHHQITQTLNAFISKKQKVGLAEVSRNLADEMRQDIMKDTGTSKLKTRVLDLIT